MTSSLPADDLPPFKTYEVESRLASVVYDLLNQVQVAMERMLCKISEIDQNSLGIIEDLERSKTSAMERTKALEKEKEKLKNDAYHVLDLFNGRDTN